MFMLSTLILVLSAAAVQMFAPMRLSRCNQLDHRQHTIEKGDSTESCPSLFFCRPTTDDREQTSPALRVPSPNLGEGKGLKGIQNSKFKIQNYLLGSLGNLGIPFSTLYNFPLSIFHCQFSIVHCQFSIVEEMLSFCYALFKLLLIKLKVCLGGLKKRLHL